jgi:cytochrome c peroxidase
VDFLKTLTDESFKPSAPSVLPSGLRPVHNVIAREGLTNQHGVPDNE